MKPIPIHVAKQIAEAYGYDQVVVIARKVGKDPEAHGERVVTYGVDVPNCAVAAAIGNFLKYKIMMWERSDNRARMEGE